MERTLQKLSWLKIRELVPEKIDTIIFPVGTVEAHGSSCIGTDNFIPEVVAQGIAERLNALVAPTVNYGITKSLYRYNGGSTITPSTFELYVRDILNSFVDTGFRNVILMNGHGGNNTSLKKVAFEFHHKMKANIAVVHWWELCHDMTIEFFGHTGGHAGTDETAMVQSIDSSLADKSAYDPELAYYFRPGADVYPVPGSILLYREGEGYPNFDAEQAAAYREKVIATVGDFAEMVLARWRKFGL
ncbi:MAG TPA: creatininase family protein [candidate division Zixibacteria bacterium]|nr:creatininase family protein [candidate division Zixibacteria bacterium]